MDGFNYISSLSHCWKKNFSVYVVPKVLSYLQDMERKKNKLQNNVSYSLVCAQCLAQRTRWRNTKQLRIVTSGERRGKLEEWQIGEGRHSCFFFFSKYFSVVWIFYNNNIFTCDLCDFKRTIKDSFSQWEMVLFIYNA